MVRIWNFQGDPFCGSITIHTLRSLFLKKKLLHAQLVSGRQSWCSPKGLNGGRSVNPPQDSHRYTAYGQPERAGVQPSSLFPERVPR